MLAKSAENRAFQQATSKDTYMNMIKTQAANISSRLQGAMAEGMQQPMNMNMQTGMNMGMMPNMQNMNMGMMSNNMGMGGMGMGMNNMQNGLQNGMQNEMQNNMSSMNNLNNMSNMSNMNNLNNMSNMNNMSSMNNINSMQNVGMNMGPVSMQNMNPMLNISAMPNMNMNTMQTMNNMQNMNSMQNVNNLQNMNMNPMARGNPQNMMKNTSQLQPPSQPQPAQNALPMLLNPNQIPNPQIAQAQNRSAQEKTREAIATAFSQLTPQQQQIVTRQAQIQAMKMPLPPNILLLPGFPQGIKTWGDVSNGNKQHLIPQNLLGILRSLFQKFSQNIIYLDPKLIQEASKQRPNQPQGQGLPHISTEDYKKILLGAMKRVNLLESLGKFGQGVTEKTKIEYAKKIAAEELRKLSRGRADPQAPADQRQVQERLQHQREDLNENRVRKPGQPNMNQGAPMNTLPMVALAASPSAFLPHNQRDNKPQNNQQLIQAFQAFATKLSADMKKYPMTDLTNQMSNQDRMKMVECYKEAAVLAKKAEQLAWRMVVFFGINEAVKQLLSIRNRLGIAFEHYKNGRHVMTPDHYNAMRMQIAKYDEFIKQKVLQNQMQQQQQRPAPLPQQFKQLGSNAASPVPSQQMLVQPQQSQPQQQVRAPPKRRALLKQTPITAPSPQPRAPAKISTPAETAATPQLTPALVKELPAVRDETERARQARVHLAESGEPERFFLSLLANVLDLPEDVVEYGIELGESDEAMARTLKAEFEQRHPERLKTPKVGVPLPKPLPKVKGEAEDGWLAKIAAKAIRCKLKEVPLVTDQFIPTMPTPPQDEKSVQNKRGAAEMNEVLFDEGGPAKKVKLDEEGVDENCFFDSIFNCDGDEDVAGEEDLLMI